MHVIEPRAYSYPAMPDAGVTILGAGNVTKSFLISAALLRPNIPIRVVARSLRSAELIRQFLNDLPRLEVEVTSTNHIPDLSNQLVVLTLGERTARFSKKSKKESLYAKNEQLIAGILPQIQNAVIIVVTNPSTAITKYLVEQGVQAYGVGVANDQLRFSNQTDSYPDHYLTGAHNFHELVLGSRHAKKQSGFTFSHEDYKKILSKQDVKCLSRSNLPFSAIDFDWEKLVQVNASFPAEHRWYARQRIHSKFHSTAISCSLAILNTICFFTKRAPLYNNFSLEMPLFLPGEAQDIVLGWPIDGASMRPLELAFDTPNYKKLTSLAKLYRVRQVEAIGPTFYLSTPFGDRITLIGRPALVHEFYRTRLAHLFSIATTPGQHEQQLATIQIEDSRCAIDKAAVGYSDSEWLVLPQHRGKNPQEHTDIRVLKSGETRIVKFPDSDAIGSFNDITRHISIYCDSHDTLFHELRRVIREEIGVPCLISRGARILHAGLVTFKGVTILVLGPSGGGKTTAVLSILSADSRSSYGAAERTLAWVSGTRVLALGVLESVTVFPGTMRQIPEFSSLASNTPDEKLWRLDQKTRLQLHDILERSGAAAIQREVPVDVIIEVVYDRSVAGAVMRSITANEDRRSVLMRNDLTEDDPVRLPWLGWFPKSYSRQLYEFAQGSDAIDIHDIRWSLVEQLRSNIIDIVARKKLYEDTLTQARVRV